MDFNCCGVCACKLACYLLLLEWLKKKRGSLSWDHFRLKIKDPSADSCTKFMPVRTCEQDGGWLFQSSFVCVGGSKQRGNGLHMAS